MSKHPVLRVLAWLAVLTAIDAITPSSTLRAEERPPCEGRNALRQPFFGDLHVHTALSLDASTQGTRLRPRDAYRFARGEEVGIQPFDESGNALRHLRLDRPLDFAAVTDHAEFFGELRICETPGLPGYDSPTCMVYRRWPRLAFFVMNSRVAAGADSTRFSYCGEGARGCLDAARAPWREVVDAAEESYDRTDRCSFTSFIGYEWTGAPDARNLHRNVLFAGSVVPDLPVSALDATIVSDLWRELERVCTKEKPGCEFLAIPHNSNLSAGLMFADTEETGAPFTPEYARLRARMEPLVELTQHKGDSECRLGAGTNDESCTFELLPYDSFAGKFMTSAEDPGPTSFVRNALKDGLLLEERLGTNPFQLGLVASTDTHLGTPGQVDEKNHPGHGGAGRPATADGPIELPDDVEFNPGGLAVLWAEENTRESLFAAMRRRETYSTSGPRITVRFFGGWSYPADLCDAASFDEIGYAGGVPMGGTLPAPPDAAAKPSFAVTALRDPGVEKKPGAPLERIQIVKGWIENGETREKVYDVATAPDEATVDEATCATSAGGASSLCRVWTDPDFDLAERAFYYARVLETPTCRWQTYFCNAAGVRCDEPDTVPPQLGACCDEQIPRTIRERAVTSPIWYGVIARGARAPRPARQSRAGPHSCARCASAESFARGDPSLHFSPDHVARRSRVPKIREPRTGGRRRRT